MLFERLMNLDVELRCLGTKAFVAKEEFVNNTFYGQPKKKKKASESEEKKDTPVTKENISDLMSKIENEKANGNDTAELEKELKEKMDKFLTAKPEKKDEPVTKESISDLMSKIENAKANGEDTTALENEVKEKMNAFLSTPKAEKVDTTPEVTPTPAATLAPPIPDQNTTTMNFSGCVQPGVTYTPGVNPLQDEMKANPELQAAVEASKSNKPTEK